MILLLIVFGYKEPPELLRRCYSESLLGRLKLYLWQPARIWHGGNDSSDSPPFTKDRYTHGKEQDIPLSPAGRELRGMVRDDRDQVQRRVLPDLQGMARPHAGANPRGRRGQGNTMLEGRSIQGLLQERAAVRQRTRPLKKSLSGWKITTYLKGRTMQHSGPDPTTNPRLRISSRAARTWVPE